MSSADRYLIWSNEHRAWWGPDHRGYTTVTLNAGVYPKEEADRICANANYAPGVCNEVAVLAPLNAREAEARTAKAGADVVRSFQELSDAVARFFDIPTPLITEHPPCKRFADAPLPQVNPVAHEQSK